MSSSSTTAGRRGSGPGVLGLRRPPARQHRQVQREPDRRRPRRPGAEHRDIQGVLQGSGKVDVAGTGVVADGVVRATKGRSDSETAPAVARTSAPPAEIRIEISLRSADFPMPAAPMTATCPPLTPARALTACTTSASRPRRLPEPTLTITPPVSGTCLQHAEQNRRCHPLSVPLEARRDCALHESSGQFHGGLPLDLTRGFRERKHCRRLGGVRLGARHPGRTVEPMARVRDLRGVWSRGVLRRC